MSDKLVEGLNGVFTSKNMSDADKTEALKHLQDLIVACADINQLMTNMALDVHVLVLHSPAFKRHLELIDDQLEAINGLKEAIERL